MISDPPKHSINHATIVIQYFHQKQLCWTSHMTRFHSSVKLYVHYIVHCCFFLCSQVALCWSLIYIECGKGCHQWGVSNNPCSANHVLTWTIYCYKCTHMEYLQSLQAGCTVVSVVRSNHPSLYTPHQFHWENQTLECWGNNLVTYWGTRVSRKWWTYEVTFWDKKNGSLLHEQLQRDSTKFVCVPVSFHIQC